MKVNYSKTGIAPRLNSVTFYDGLWGNIVRGETSVLMTTKMALVLIVVITLNLLRRNRLLCKITTLYSPLKQIGIS